jgi:hypothetical protein
MRPPEAWQINLRVERLFSYKILHVAVPVYVEKGLSPFCGECLRNEFSSCAKRAHLQSFTGRVGVRITAVVSGLSVNLDGEKASAGGYHIPVASVEPQLYSLADLLAVFGRVHLSHTSHYSANGIRRCVYRKRAQAEICTVEVQCAWPLSHLLCSS